MSRPDKGWFFFLFRFCAFVLAVWLSCTWAGGNWGGWRGEFDDLSIFLHHLCIWVPWFSLSYKDDEHPACD